MSTALPRQDEEKTLLLVCYTLKNIEEIQFLKETKNDQGQWDQSENPFLQRIVYPHDQKGCKGRLVDIDAFLWMSSKGRKAALEGIKKQLLEGSIGLDILGDFYDVKANFSNDAMACYGQHNRPKGQCPDYKSSSKILKPDTAADRKEAGLDLKKMPKTYLCDFCPVKSYNMMKHNTEKGYYK
jgi:hypothetical protein